MVENNKHSTLTSNTAISGAKRSSPFNTLFLLLITITVGFFGGWLGAGSREQQNSNNFVSNQQIILSESQLINRIATEVGESVVSINVTSEEKTRDFLGNRRSYLQDSAGTGFILNEEGIILTNRHVIPDGVTSVSITLADGTKLDDVEVIGKTNSSDSLDVAFLKITDSKGKKLKPVKLGDSAKVLVGERVIAIGNALGQFQNTVTSGIISGFGRSLDAGEFGDEGEVLQNLFQTDAAINQGNSGGPLVNINGEVIGINTAVAGGGAENIGFSIPINDVKGLIESVLTEGKLLRPFLGVRYIPLTDDIAFELELDITRGAYIMPSESGVSSVVADSPAAKAGLQEEDVITHINDDKVDENNSLTSLIGKHKVGTSIDLTILRGGEELTVNVTLEVIPADL